MSTLVLPDVFASYPSVYAVGREYQIFIVVKSEVLMWVKVGEEEYFDDSNGILRSAGNTRKMLVPMEELDKAKSYTVCFRRVEERLPYFSKTGDVEKITFSFRSVPEDTIRVYHIADTHNQVDLPVQTASFFGDKLDLLILNGDIPNHSGEIENFMTIHEITSKITKGEIPAVSSRGNHDLRGIHAEELASYMPTRHGHSFYTFRLGALWGILVDCGEDKDDSHAAYGNTICCHAFRKRETKYIEKVIRNAAKEYEEEGVKYKVVISHVPFSYVQKEPFNIEQDCYRKWCSLLKEHIKPHVMLSGHLHRSFLSLCGSENDHLGQPCPLVVGSKTNGKEPEKFAGAALTFSKGEILVQFSDQAHSVYEEAKIPMESEKGR